MRDVTVKYFLALILMMAGVAPCRAGITTDLSAVKPGPIRVSASEGALKVEWKDAQNRQWDAEFSLEGAKTLIREISMDGRAIITNANPVYRCSTGIRRGGWDAFFDFPPSAPEGTRSFVQEFHPEHAAARTVGDRVEVDFDGMRLGIFHGVLRYVFYPESALIQQVVVLSTDAPDTAYTYDAGLRMEAKEDRAPGLNMASSVLYYDKDGALRRITPPYGSERHTAFVHYRAIAAKSGAGSVALFPAPHRYFFARDYSTNLGYAWYSSWRGQISLGVQQPPDDDTPIYPWINAPPGTQQEMGVFLLLGSGEASETLEQVLAYTHRDRYPHIDGYVTLAPHWHLAYTEQAMAHDAAWEPPFRPVLKEMGIDSAMIMDFHIDGHPTDLTGIRLAELEEYYRVCRGQSGKDFLLIPAEEANVILGGHWGLMFPKPVYWYMDRKPDQPFKTTDAHYGTVYRVHTPEEMWKMIAAEDGYVYQTHPRTKGSTGYPDKIKDTEYFRDSRYLGVGWKAMPSDLSSPRLGERAFRTLDDLNNRGLHKIMIGEVDMFQVHADDELYAHMNANYVRMRELPDFDHYSRLVDALTKGDGFISTGEILLPSFSITQESGDGLRVEANVTGTFPLRFAEIVWGDGKTVQRKQMDLQTSHGFANEKFTWTIDAPGWKWARLAVWDIAADGAFTNPVWRK